MRVLIAIRNLITVRARRHFGPIDDDNAENVINLIEYFNPDITEIRKTIDKDEYVISFEPKQNFD